MYKQIVLYNVNKANFCPFSTSNLTVNAQFEVFFIIFYYKSCVMSQVIVRVISVLFSEVSSISASVFNLFGYRILKLFYITNAQVRQSKKVILMLMSMFSLKVP